MKHENKQDNNKNKKEHDKQGSNAVDMESICKEETAKKPEQTEPEQKVSDYYDQLLRLRAEFENYRKRIEKEKPELIKWGKVEILYKLLPLYDVVMQAHLHISKARDCGENTNGSFMDEIVKGLELIFKEFSKVFESEEIREMEVLGRPYDPMAVEIMGVVDGDDSNDGKVVEELQKGFYIGDKVLRPARVKIAKKKTDKNNEIVETGL